MEPEIKPLLAQLYFGADPSNCITISGGYDSPKTWRKFLADLKPKHKPYFKVLKQHVVDNKMLGICGSEMRECHFKFTNGVSIAFTMRAWAEFMSAVMNLKQGWERYYLTPGTNLQANEQNKKEEGAQV